MKTLKGPAVSHISHIEYIPDALDKKCTIKIYDSANRSVYAYEVSNMHQIVTLDIPLGDTFKVKASRHIFMHARCIGMEPPPRHAGLFIYYDRPA